MIHREESFVNKNKESSQTFSMMSDINLSPLIENDHKVLKKPLVSIPPTTELDSPLVK